MRNKGTAQIRVKKNTLSRELPAFCLNRGEPMMRVQLIDPGEEVGQSEGVVQCRERIGGLPRYYYREAA